MVNYKEVYNNLKIIYNDEILTKLCVYSSLKDLYQNANITDEIVDLFHYEYLKNDNYYNIYEYIKAFEHSFDLNYYISFDELDKIQEYLKNLV